MKFKYLICFFVVLWGTTVLAQQGNKKGNNDRFKESIEKMATELELEESQRVSFIEILEGSMEKRKALRKEGLTREEMKVEIKEINEAENEELKKILDEGQYNEFLELKKELRQRMRENNQNGRKRQH